MGVRGCFAFLERYGGYRTVGNLSSELSAHTGKPLFIIDVFNLAFELFRDVDEKELVYGVPMWLLERRLLNWCERLEQSTEGRVQKSEFIFVLEGITGIDTPTTDSVRLQEKVYRKGCTWQDACQACGIEFETNDRQKFCTNLWTLFRQGIFSAVRNNFPREHCIIPLGEADDAIIRLARKAVASQRLVFIFTFDADLLFVRDLPNYVVVPPKFIDFDTSDSFPRFRVYDGLKSVRQAVTNYLLEQATVQQRPRNEIERLLSDNILCQSPIILSEAGKCFMDLPLLLLQKAESSQEDYHFRFDDDAISQPYEYRCRGSIKMDPVLLNMWKRSLKYNRSNIFWNMMIHAKHPRLMFAQSDFLRTETFDLLCDRVYAQMMGMGCGKARSLKKMEMEEQDRKTRNSHIAGSNSSNVDGSDAAPSTGNVGLHMTTPGSLQAPREKLEVHATKPFEDADDKESDSNEPGRKDNRENETLKIYSLDDARFAGLPDVNMAPVQAAFSFLCLHFAAISSPGSLTPLMKLALRAAAISLGYRTTLGMGTTRDPPPYFPTPFSDDDHVALKSFLLFNRFLSLLTIESELRLGPDEIIGDATMGVLDLTTFIGVFRALSANPTSFRSVNVQGLLTHHSRDVLLPLLSQNLGEPDVASNMEDWETADNVLGKAMNGCPVERLPSVKSVVGTCVGMTVDSHHRLEVADESLREVEIDLKQFNIERVYWRDRIRLYIVPEGIEPFGWKVVRAFVETRAWHHGEVFNVTRKSTFIRAKDTAHISEIRKLMNGNHPVRTKRQSRHMDDDDTDGWDDSELQYVTKVENCFRLRNCTFPVGHRVQFRVLFVRDFEWIRTERRSRGRCGMNEETKTWVIKALACDLHT